MIRKNQKNIETISLCNDKSKVDAKGEISVKKVISIILTVVIIITSITVAAMFSSVQNPILDGVRFAIFFVASSRTDIEKKSFKENYDSYNTVVEYLQTVIDEHPEESSFCFVIHGSAKENIELVKINLMKDNEIFEISEEVAEALAVIDKAFSKMGYDLDAIVIKNGCISFNTIDRYCLVYSESGAENVKERFKQNSDITVKKLQKNWYNVFTGFVL